MLCLRVTLPLAPHHHILCVRALGHEPIDGEWPIGAVGDSVLHPGARTPGKVHACPTGQAQEGGARAWGCVVRLLRLHQLGRLRLSHEQHLPPCRHARCPVRIPELAAGDVGGVAIGRKAMCTHSAPPACLRLPAQSRGRVRLELEEEALGCVAQAHCAIHGEARGRVPLGSGAEGRFSHRVPWGWPGAAPGRMDRDWRRRV
mmetsp:Transcript_17040/g.46027  ORF Transcript_17040/g.46027 Transcript_17040/m.46027 type:complete len:202 (-) Transcript_17040:151-756(-)